MFQGLVAPTRLLLVGLAPSRSRYARSRGVGLVIVVVVVVEVGRELCFFTAVQAEVGRWSGGSRRVVEVEG